jgi:hypothetical protein
MHAGAVGLATSWRRNGYTFETCLLWLRESNHRPMYARWEEVFDIGRLAVVDPQEYVRLETEHSAFRPTSVKDVGSSSLLVSRSRVKEYHGIIKDDDP